VPFGETGKPESVLTIKLTNRAENFESAHNKKVGPQGPTQGDYITGCHHAGRTKAANSYSFAMLRCVK
jgi:hypothetical protein